MARRLIGLDIGTNAVTIAEVTAGTPPRLDMFAQVALPRDAMREGEVADEAAITDAVARLRTEVGLKKVPGARGHRQPARCRAPGRDAGHDARRVDERVAVPGGRPHPDPDRRRGPRLRDPRDLHAGSRFGCRTDDAGVARRRVRGDRRQARLRDRGRRPRGRRGRPHSARPHPGSGPPRDSSRWPPAPRAESSLDEHPARRASCRSVVASPRSRCTRTASRSSCVCSAAVGVSSPTRSPPI